LILAPLLLGCGAKPVGTVSRSGADESCVGPYLDGQPPNGRYARQPLTVRPGQNLKIYGHWYTTTCNDTTVNGTPANDPLRPLPPVRLTLTLPGGHRHTLGHYTPTGRDLGFTAAIRIPINAKAGTATVSDDRRYPTTYSFKIANR